MSQKGLIHSICWCCKRSNADEGVNPLGYCSWVAAGKLPEGCEVVPAARSHRVIKCPLFEAEGK